MPSDTTKGKFSLAVRSMLSIILIAAFVYQIGSAQILEQMKIVRWEIICLVVAILATNVLIVTPRWSTILSALGYQVQATALVASVFIGFLFNQLLPTGVGGDVLRAWRAKELGVPIEIAIHSVLIDRGAGVFVAFLGAAVLLPFAQPYAGRGGLQWMLGGLTVAGLVGCVILWALGRVNIVRIRLFGLLRVILAVRNSVALLLARPTATLGTFALACANQLLPVAAIWLLANEMQIRLAFADIAFVTFVSTLAATVPISFAGWGVREGALVFLFGLYQVQPEASFALSVLYGAALAISATPGAVLLLSPHAGGRAAG